MKKFILVTKSESGDTYAYGIEHPTKPNGKDIKKFLMTHGSDIEDGELYEDQELLVEIKEFKTIP